MDFEPEELKRRSSISSAFHQFEWKKTRINLIDTPGDQNFFSDTRMCMQAADSALVVIDAIDGIKVQSEQAWDIAEEFNLPVMIYINKVDRERADFYKALEDARNIFSPKPIMLQLPIGKEEEFQGVVDLLSMKAMTFQDGKAATGEIPADLLASAESERESLVENIAEADDELVEKYLEGEELSAQDLFGALRKGILNRTFAPVVCGAAVKQIGVHPLYELFVGAMPSPVDRGPKTGYEPGTENEITRKPDPAEPFSGLVFKTIADPYSGRLTVFKVVSGSLAGDGTC